MKYNFIGKNIDVSESLKAKVASKLDRLNKLFPNDCEAQVTFSVEKLDNIVEVTIPVKKRVLRAESRSFDMYSAIDEIVDVVEKQMIKYKTRLRDRARVDNTFNDEFKMLFNDDSNTFDGNILKIERTKRFALKPMDAEEAVMEMELLGHSFFVFRDCDSDDINVVYKRNNGTYGLIEPEY